MVGENIRKVREGKGYTQNSLGDILNLSPSAIGMYEQGRRLPDAETIIKMCGLFNVSSDYLLEMTENPKPYKSSCSGDAMQQRLNNLVGEGEADKSRVAEMAKIRKSRLDDILSGKSPNINELRLLAECFGETTDYLLCITDEHRAHESRRHDLHSFQGRLSILMDGYTELEVSDELDISIKRFRKLLNGDEIPEPFLLQQIADFFCVSTDFLLGIRRQTRDRLITGKHPFPMDAATLGRIQSVLGNNVDEYWKGMLGLSDDEWFMFYHYGFIPHIYVLTELCRITEISPDYLLGFSDSTLSIKKDDASDEDSLLTSYRKLGTHYRRKVDSELSEQILQQERDLFMKRSVAADAPLKEAK